jgi:hypothetical protein
LKELCSRAGLEIVEIHPHGSLFSLMGHKLNTFLALKIAHAGALAQSIGKLGHEAEATGSGGVGLRWWSLPLVAPAMVTISVLARLLDRILPDPTETLGFSLIARHLENKPGRMSS